MPRTLALTMMATLALADVAFSAPLKPQEICARWASTKPMALIVACSEVIRTDPDAAWAYLNRGIAHGAGGDSEREIADYTRALSHDPALTSALQNRGIAHFDRGDFAEAANDLAKVVNTTGNPFAMLYLFLARLRAHVPYAAAELETNSAKLIASNVWPTAIVEVYLGKMQAPALIKVAATREQRCQAQFYMAEWLASGPGEAEAAKPLRMAAAICAKNSIEFGSALAELKRLGIGPPKPKSKRGAQTTSAPAAPGQ